MKHPMLIGEAWGDEEALFQKHFIGPSGQELKRMCEQAKLDFDECPKTNILHLQPPKNNFEALCDYRKNMPPGYPIKKAVSSGKWLKAEYLPELDRLYQEIVDYDPNVIISLGAIPVWALLQKQGIFKNRGHVTYMTELVNGKQFPRPIKVLPTFHPAFILRSWQYRIIAVADMMKAKTEAKSPTIDLDEREILIAETLDDLKEFDSLLRNCDLLSFDVETARNQITCISFSPGPWISCVVPILDRRKEDWCYWSASDELEVRRWMKSLLESPIPKLVQNSLFDVQFLANEGIFCQNVCEDTMLIHHALWPELPKGLGFMASVHTNAPNWKDMVKTEGTKRDD